MRVITINPFFKFFFLIFQFIICYTIDDFRVLVIFLLLSLIMAFINKVKLKTIFKVLTFGLFLSIFTTIFNFIIFKTWVVALLKGLNVLVIYLIIILYSLTYKKVTTNKEIAYVISYLFLPLKIFGYNQNKLYTIILIVLNQVNVFKNVAIKMYKYNKISTDNKYHQLIMFIPSFINNILSQNDKYTVAMISKGYNEENKRVNPYLIYRYNYMHYMILVLYLLLEIFLVVKY